MREGITTAFYDPVYAGQVRYYVADATGACWIGGADAGWYEAASCTAAEFVEIAQ